MDTNNQKPQTATTPAPAPAPAPQPVAPPVPTPVAPQPAPAPQPVQAPIPSPTPAPTPQPVAPAPTPEPVAPVPAPAPEPVVSTQPTEKVIQPLPSQTFEQPDEQSNDSSNDPLTAPTEASTEADKQFLTAQTVIQPLEKPADAQNSKPNELLSEPVYPPLQAIGTGKTTITVEKGRSFPTKGVLIAAGLLAASAALIVVGFMFFMPKDFLAKKWTCSNPATTPVIIDLTKDEYIIADRANPDQYSYKGPFKSRKLSQETNDNVNYVITFESPTDIVYKGQHVTSSLLSSITILGNMNMAISKKNNTSVITFDDTDITFTCSAK